MAPKRHCPYCGGLHERYEDAACGCGCGDEPMGCSQCMTEGGPPRRFDSSGHKKRQAYRALAEDPYGPEFFDIY